jgi:hypothetical protein
VKASNPGFFRGALVSLLLLAPLMALNYLAAQLFTVPFVPYGLFEYLTRVLPGPLITRGIDTMVGVMNALSLPVDDLAKAAEQGLAVAIFLILGVLVGGSYFALFRGTRTGWAAGLLPGLILGVAGGGGDLERLRHGRRVGLTARSGCVHPLLARPLRCARSACQAPPDPR